MNQSVKTINPYSPAWFVDAHQPEAPVPILSALTMGRAFDNDFVLLHESVAEYQCRIERVGSATVIKDRRSGIPTLVNGTSVIEAYLQSGDEVRVGEKVFYFAKDIETLRAPQFGLQSKNQSLQKQLELLKNVAKSDFPILLLGASGTGKELFAEAAHQGSDRSEGPLVKVNCSALTESLIESELFGHLKGSFTGASHDRKGAFETARKGTLFLDEIGDLPLSAQAKLLRVLENKEIRAVGSDRVIKTNVRIIAATHPTLLKKVKDGRFREDLYFRLNVVTIHTPRLVDRIEDFEDIVNQLGKEYRIRFSEFALEALKNYSWPGNIRELKNFVARASALFPFRTLEPQDVHDLLGEPVYQNQQTSHEDIDTLSEMLALPASKSVPVGMTSLKARPRPQKLPPGALPMVKQIEKQLIVKHLIENQGNQRRTALQMGLAKSTLYDRIKAYKIDPRRYELSSYLNASML
jgi:DNA-binding NtrC family response regulator